MAENDDHPDAETATAAGYAQAATTRRARLAVILYVGTLASAGRSVSIQASLSVAHRSSPVADKPRSRVVQCPRSTPARQTTRPVNS
jgi:hypothetical protein